MYSELGALVTFELDTGIDGGCGTAVGCVRLESPRPYVGFPSSPGIILASTSCAPVSNQSLDANMVLEKKREAPHLQNCSIDEAHIPHNPNCCVCELFMAS